MNNRGESQPQSSDAQSPTKEAPEFDQVALELFKARLVTDLEPDEQHFILEICQLTTEIHGLLTEVQQTYDKHKASLVAEVALREEIERRIKASLSTQQFTTCFLLGLQELAIRVDILSGSGGFRDFMRSRFASRFCQDIFEHQLDAKTSLIDCKIKIHFRTSSEMIVDDFSAVAHYMSSVNTYFNREFKKYAADVLPAVPTDEEIGKLGGLVSCMCFHGVRSIGRLFAHAQFLRRKLEASEESFLDIWWSLPIEEVNRVSFPLAIARDALHSTRRSTMILIALAMRFVDDDDRFISYCRAQEDRIAREADLLYVLQDQIHHFIVMMRHFTSDFSPENMKRKVSSILTDPIDVKMMEFGLRVPQGYNVFLVHDGSKDCIELAICLQSEIQNRTFSCYLEGIEYDDGEVMSDQTERALDDASVGVFLLTPEFAKRKKKVAQLEHMIRRTRNTRVGWPGPTLIPVFFMVGIADCRSGTIFGEASEEADVGFDKDVAKKAFHFVTRYTGIENLDGARVGDSEGLDERCMGLVRRTADAVAEVCFTTLKEFEEKMQQSRNSEKSEKHKENLEGLSDLVLQYRRLQREAREKAILDGERDPFRTV